MAFWAYMLRCADGRYYAGHTDALERRIAEHRAGKGCDYTARRLPVDLVWSADFGSRIEALEAERRIKGWSRAKKQTLIAGDWAGISKLAAAHEVRPSTSLRTSGDGSEPDTQFAIRPNPVARHPSDETPAP